MMRSAWVLAVAGVGLLGATSMAQPLPVPTLGEPSPVFAPSNGVVQGPALGDPTLGDPTLGGPVYQPAPGFSAPGYSAPAPVLPGYGPGVPQAVPSEPWMAQPLPFSPTVPLYPNVRYKQTRNAHPCATPLVVAVKDPRCGRCGPSECLYVKICVPPCDAPCRVVANRDGSRVRYDWGKYAVTVQARRNGVVYVDYDD
jgi:hypothetical protein